MALRTRRRSLTGHRPWSLLLAFALAGGLAAGESDQQKEGKLRLGHYSSGDGLVGLVLDRSAELPLLRFDGSSEILALSAEQVSRGTSILKGDDGAGWLTISDYGQVTAHLEGRASVRVYRDSNAEPLTPSDDFEGSLSDRAREHSQRVTKVVGTSIEFKIDEADPAVPARFAEAMDNASRALQAVGGDELGKEALAAQVRIANFVAAAAAGVELSGTTLIVKVAAAGGIRGRLSSRAIRKFLEAEL